MQRSKIIILRVWKHESAFQEFGDTDDTREQVQGSHLYFTLKEQTYLLLDP